ncbi:unnamed protein product [Dovyalis caffra]|uniref:Uncharacterized protein n=1 Tax=Dovyalis caffra TaxID=77055 RepID=A0AAV1SH02_9ROSI|nr:unnamed protein product [Dovyalis caffra]
MKRALLKNFSLCTRNLLLSPPKLNPNPSRSLPHLAVSTRFRLSRFYSSESDSSSQSKFLQTQKSSGSIEDADKLSTQEIKNLVEKFYGGEEEALPLIFDAIMKRKLAGIPDDELRKELYLNSPTDDFEEDEFDSDIEGEWIEIDEDGDNLLSVDSAKKAGRLIMTEQFK